MSDIVYKSLVIPIKREQYRVCPVCLNYPKRDNVLQTKDYDYCLAFCYELVLDNVEKNNINWLKSVFPKEFGNDDHQ